MVWTHYFVVMLNPNPILHRKETKVPSPSLSFFKRNLDPWPLWIWNSDSYVMRLLVLVCLIIVCSKMPKSQVMRRKYFIFLNVFYLTYFEVIEMSFIYENVHINCIHIIRDKLNLENYNIWDTTLVYIYLFIYLSIYM